MQRFPLSLAIVALVLVSCRPAPPPHTAKPLAEVPLTSLAFAEGGTVPQQHTCDGADISPVLRWGPVPAGTRSLALICDDPDAGGFVHWVLYGLPPSTTELSEGIPAVEVLPDGAKQGVNDFGRVGYGGPCPPSGKAHRYVFTLYALDADISLSPRASRDQLTRAMAGHILAEGRLVGTYARR